jgi:hypothetical protein
MSSDWRPPGADHLFADDALLPGKGKRLRGYLVFNAIMCLLPVAISSAALLFSSLRSFVQHSVAAGPLVMAVVGLAAGIALIATLLWTRTHVVGDAVRRSSLRKVGLLLILLGSLLLIGGGVGVIVSGATFALDGIAAAVAIAINGIIAMIAGSFLGTVANQKVSQDFAG